MALSSKSTFWFEHFYPGLLASIQSLDRLGVLDECPGEFKVRTQGTDAIRGVKLGIAFSFADRHTITIVERLALKSDQPSHCYKVQTVQLCNWAAYYYCLRFKDPEGQNIFGFDLHELSSGNSEALIHHVHFDVHPHQENHTPAQEFEPDPRNMDPRQFVAHVAEYRRTKKFPVTRKKKS